MVVVFIDFLDSSNEVVANNEVSFFPMLLPHERFLFKYNGETTTFG